MTSLTSHGLQKGPGPTITIQQQLAEDFDNDPDSKVRRPAKKPALDNIDPMPLRPDNKKNIDAILDARTKLPTLNFGGAGIHNNFGGAGIHSI